MDPEPEGLAASLAREAKRIEEDSIYSAKSQFIEARFWSRVHYLIGVPTAILAAIAGASAFAENNSAAGMLASIVAALTAAATVLNPSEKASRHHSAGTRYLGLRNQARVFHEIDLLAKTEMAACLPRLKELVEQRDALNAESPQVSQRSFMKARRALESGEARYEADQS